MKKTTIAFLFGIIGGGLFAQEPVSSGYTEISPSNKPLRMGVYVEPSLGFFSKDSKRFASDGTRISLNYGLIADIRLNENNNYAFSTGLALVNSGGTITYNNAADLNPDPQATTLVRSEVEAEYKLRYIKIPLLMKLRTNEIGYMTYFAQVGFDLGLNIRARRDLEETYQPLEQSRITTISENDDVTSEIQMLRASLSIGAGAEYNLQGNTSIMLALTWNNGLINAFTKKAELYHLDQNANPIEDNPSERMKAVLNYFGLTAAVFF